MKKRIAVVGFGAIGRHHARNLATLPGAELVGVMDVSPDARAEASASGYPVIENFDDVLSARLDGAIVCVPTAFHLDVAVNLLNHGVGVLVEKPIAQTVAQGEVLIQTAARLKSPLMVGYVERYNPAVVALKRFVESGDLGRPLFVAARRVGTMPARIKDANVLIDIGVHDLDAVAFITGATLTLRSAMGGRAILDDRLDYAALAVDAGGVAAHVESNWITPVKIRELYVTGENGVCHVDYMTQTARFAAARAFSAAPTFENFVEQYNVGEFIDLPVEREEPLRRELRAFLGGLNGEPLPDPYTSLSSLGIAEEATAKIEANLLQHR